MSSSSALFGVRFQKVVVAGFCVLSVVLSSLVAGSTPARAVPVTVSARQLLDLLPVAAEAGSSSYSRDAFRHWTDADSDCQDTRAEVLVRDSRSLVSFYPPRRCFVLSGAWFSWYDGSTLTKASDVDIDHLVALKEAWVSNASSWSAQDRERFANDLGFPGSLQAVRDTVNQAKSDKDPSRWLPTLVSARCRYATLWVQVKYRWRLNVDQAERSALAGVLSRDCGTAEVSVPARAR